jgi:hypothetical protein
MTNKINISSFYESDEDIQSVINVCNKYFYIDDYINKKQLEYVIKNNEVYHYFDYNNHDRKIIEELLDNMEYVKIDHLEVSEYKANASHSLTKDLTKNILNNNQEIIIKNGNSQNYS